MEVDVNIIIKTPPRVSAAKVAQLFSTRFNNQQHFAAQVSTVNKKISKEVANAFWSNINSNQPFFDEKPKVKGKSIELNYFKGSLEIEGIYDALLRFLYQLFPTISVEISLCFDEPDCDQTLSLNDQKLLKDDRVVCDLLAQKNVQLFDISRHDDHFYVSNLYIYAWVSQKEPEGVIPTDEEWASYDPDLHKQIFEVYCKHVEDTDPKMHEPYKLNLATMLDTNKELAGQPKLIGSRCYIALLDWAMHEHAVILLAIAKELLQQGVQCYFETDNNFEKFNITNLRAYQTRSMRKDDIRIPQKINKLLKMHDVKLTPLKAINLLVERGVITQVADKCFRFDEENLIYGVNSEVKNGTTIMPLFYEFRFFELVEQYLQPTTIQYGAFK